MQQVQLFYLLITALIDVSMSSYKRVWPKPGWTGGSTILCEDTWESYIIWKNVPYYVTETYEDKNLMNLQLEDMHTKTSAGTIELPPNYMITIPAVDYKDFEVMEITNDGILILKNFTFDHDDSNIPNMNISKQIDFELMVDHWKTESPPIFCTIRRFSWPGDDGEHHRVYDYVGFNWQGQQRDPTHLEGYRTIIVEGVKEGKPND